MVSVKDRRAIACFDGNWAHPKLSGRFAARLIAQMDRIIGPDNNYDGAMSERHATIMDRLPFGAGLTARRDKSVSMPIREPTLSRFALLLQRPPSCCTDGNNHHGAL